MDNTVGSLPIRHDQVTTEAKSQNRLDSSNYYTPAYLMKTRNISEYISGYVDGEVCFTVTFNKRAKAKF